MSELKELFDMVTKQTEPDLNSWKEQEERQRRTARKRKLGAFAATAAVIVAGVVGFAALRDGDGDVVPPLSSPTESSGGATNAVSHSFVDLSTGERTQVPTYLGTARLPEVSPNGLSIAYSTCCSYDSLFVVALDGSSDPVQLSPDGVDGYGASWIDDETILFQGRPSGTDQLGELYTVNVSTGDVQMVTDLPDERNGSWIVISDISPDSSTVLFHLPRGKGQDAEWDLWTAPLAGGEPTLLRKDAGFAAYAPDGSIVFLDHPEPFESDELWMMDSDGGNARSIASGGTYAFPDVSPDGTRVLVGTGENGPPTVVDIATGEATAIDGALGSEGAWYDDETVIVD